MKHNEPNEPSQQEQVLELLKHIQQDLTAIHKEITVVKSEKGNNGNMLYGDDLMDFASVCAFLSISDRQLRRYKQQKLITAVKLGKRRLFRTREVRRFYDEFIIKECK